MPLSRGSPSYWGATMAALPITFLPFPTFLALFSHLSSYLVLRFSTILTRVYYASGRVRGQVDARVGPESTFELICK